MNIIIKQFCDFTPDELYAVLKLRNEVFVVEQNCNYLDTDDKDQLAYHLIGYKKDKIVAYARVFKPHDYYKESSIGRVLVPKNERKYGYGHSIVKKSIEFIKQEFGNHGITISAQSYLVKFYQNLGFKTISDEYMDCGIPHIKMSYTATT